MVAKYRDFYDEHRQPLWDFSRDLSDYRINAPSFYDYLAKLNKYIVEFSDYLNTQGEEVKKDVDRLLAGLQEEYEKKHAELQRLSQEKIDHLTEQETTFNQKIEKAAEHEQKAFQYRADAQGSASASAANLRATREARDSVDEKIKKIEGVMDMVNPTKNIYYPSVLGQKGPGLISTSGDVNYININGNSPFGAVGLRYAKVVDLKGDIYEYLSPSFDYVSLAVPDLNTRVCTLNITGMGLTDNLVNQLRTYTRTYPTIFLNNGMMCSAWIRIKGDEMEIGVSNFVGKDGITAPVYADVSLTNFEDWVVKTPNPTPKSGTPII